MSDKLNYYLNRSGRALSQNITNEQILCSRSTSDRAEILRNCPKLQYKDGFYVLNHTIHVAIKRHQSIIDALFTGVVIVLVTGGTLCIGCGLEIDQLKSNFKRPIPLIIGLFCQIVYLPLLSVAISKIFRSDDPTSLGLLSTASTPGGGSSNIYTALLAGDVDLSVCLTFISTTIAFGTFPFWIWALGKTYVDFSKAKFPWWSMFLSMITLFLPAMTGFLLRRYRPVLAHRIARFLNPIAVGKFEALSSIQRKSSNNSVFFSGYLVFILTFGGTLYLPPQVPLFNCCLF